MNQNEFHFARRMFAIIDDELLVAPLKDSRTHIEWFMSERWVESTDDPKFETIVRGYYLPDRHIVAYIGHDFTGNKLVAETLMKYLARLQLWLDIPYATPVFVGARPSGETVWEPQKSLGTVNQALGQWRTKCKQAKTVKVLDIPCFQLQHHNHEQMPVKGQVIQEDSGALAVYLEGYGNHAMMSGAAPVCYFEVDDEGYPVLYIFTNYNQEDFTHKISFRQAKEPSGDDHDRDRDRGHDRDALAAPDDAAPDDTARASATDDTAAVDSTAAGTEPDSTLAAGSR